MLAVQIVNYRTKTHLAPCVESLRPALDAAGVPWRLLVLENGSGDDLSDVEAELVVSEENRGFGGGHNLLAARHDSPLLCFVNPDVVAEQRDVFARLLDALGDERAAVAGPLLRTPDGALQHFDHGELRGLRAVVANGAGHAHWRPRSERTEVAWVSGAFLLVRRAAFDAVGGFDEGFFLYKEDEDLCLRLRQAGGTVLYEPAVTVEHVGSVVARRDPEQLGASVDRYRDKHGAPALARGLHRLTRRL